MNVNVKAFIFYLISENMIKAVFIEENIAIFVLVLLVLVAALLIVVVYCFFLTSKIKRKSEVFLRGKDGKTLEKTISENLQSIRTIDTEIQELYNISNQIHNLASRSVHKVEILRFNPFNDIGGDQSFSVALLDGRNTGVVISSLHTKEGTRVYAKPIIKGEEGKYALTQEEKQVVKMAIQKKSNKV